MATKRRAPFQLKHGLNGITLHELLLASEAAGLDHKSVSAALARDTFTEATAAPRFEHEVNRLRGWAIDLEDVT
jgi:hypothetical protein